MDDMNAEKLMTALKECEAARRSIPLQLQASLPLMARRAEGTAECWYYRLQTDAEGIVVWSPTVYVLWDIGSMTILEQQSLSASPLGDGRDVITREHREREDAYLAGIDADYAGASMEEKKASSWQQADRQLRSDRTEEWLLAAPEVLRPWLEEAIA